MPITTEVLALFSRPRGIQEACSTRHVVAWNSSNLLCGWFCLLRRGERFSLGFPNYQRSDLALKHLRVLRRLLRDRARCRISDSPEQPLVYQLGPVSDSPGAHLGHI